MAQTDFTEIAGASITTPGTGVVSIFAETDALFRAKLPSGAVKNLSQYVNFSTASQAPTAATRTYLTGSQIALPAAGRLQIGTAFRWRFDMTKTAAGTTAAHTWDVAFGTAGTTADTARISFVSPAGTGVAAVDTAWVEIEVVVRGPLTASGVASGNINVLTNNSTGGFFATGRQVYAATVQSGTFDVTTPTFVGVCLTTGTSTAATIQQVFAEVFNL